MKLMTGLIRLALTPVIVWLNNHDIITTDEGVQLVLDVAAFAAVVLSMVWARVKDQRSIHTALAMPSWSTVNDLKVQVKYDPVPAFMSRGERPSL